MEGPQRHYIDLVRKPHGPAYGRAMEATWSPYGVAIKGQWMSYGGFMERPCSIDESAARRRYGEAIEAPWHRTITTFRRRGQQV